MKLKVGAIKTNVETEEKLRRRASLSQGTGSNGNNGGGGGGNGGDGSDDNLDNKNLSNEKSSFAPDKLRVVMWFLLLVVLMTFGGLVSAYIVIATNGVAEWRPFNLPFQIWISTALILASSVTYQIAAGKLKNDLQTSAKNWLLATTVLGAMFISSQILAWFELVRRGVYLSSNPYAGFFYILTAVHAFHVLGGIVALGYIVLRTWQETYSEDEMLRRKTVSSVVGWYWHFLDGLWIVLVLLLGFWK